MRHLQTYSTAAVLASSLFAFGCGGGSSAKMNSITSSGNNIAPISVNAGPNGNYANGVFVSVTVCVPSSSTCQTVPDVLVDTGSSGLRILSSALTVTLQQQNGAGGPVAECLPFISGFTWGPVQTADIQIAGETASAVPIQVISATAFPVPKGCSSFGPSIEDLQSLGANGLLGVGLAGPDCGTACAQTGNSNPGLYYDCPTSGCAVAAEAVAQQVQNPVGMFAHDNNGVIVELPAVSGAAANLSGSLVFGIGTQSNNALNGATIYTVDNFGNFTTTYNGQSYSSSFIDSGSNGYFFLDSGITGIPGCSNASGFYCPTSTQNLTATNQGANGAKGTVNFSVANAETLFANSADSVFGDLGGPGQDFDWGLPFFFGRNVYVAIEGASTPGGTGPYWAY
jgi:predicted aspartyl protease